MKKLLAVAVLFVLAILAFVQVLPVHATAIPTRCRFRPYNGSPCNDQGRNYRAGPDTDYTVMDLSGATMYTVNPGSCIEMDIKTSCCGGHPQIGYTWEEWWDGSSWHLLSPTFVAVYQPVGVATVEYDENGNGQLNLGNPISHHSCP